MLERTAEKLPGVSRRRFLQTSSLVALAFALEPTEALAALSQVSENTDPCFAAAGFINTPSGYGAGVRGVVVEAPGGDISRGLVIGREVVVDFTGPGNTSDKKARRVTYYGTANDGSQITPEHELIVPCTKKMSGIEFNATGILPPPVPTATAIRPTTAPTRRPENTKTPTPVSMIAVEGIRPDRWIGIELKDWWWLPVSVLTGLILNALLRRTHIDVYTHPGVTAPGAPVRPVEARPTSSPDIAPRQRRWPWQRPAAPAPAPVSRTTETTTRSEEEGSH